MWCAAFVFVFVFINKIHIIFYIINEHKIKNLLSVGLYIDETKEALENGKCDDNEAVQKRKHFLTMRTFHTHWCSVSKTTYCAFDEQEQPLSFIYFCSSGDDSILKHPTKEKNKYSKQCEFVFVQSEQCVTSSLVIVAVLCLSHWNAHHLSGFWDEFCIRIGKLEWLSGEVIKSLCEFVRRSIGRWRTTGNKK